MPESLLLEQSRWFAFQVELGKEKPSPGNGDRQAIRDGHADDRAVSHCQRC